MNDNNNIVADRLQDFLSAASGSREVGLVIAKNDKELESLSGLLEANGLGILSSFLEYKNVDHGWYVIAEKDNMKEIYDFVCQYPLTAISLFDSKNANTVVINPDYKHQVIVLINKEDLGAIRSSYDLLGRAGVAYQI